MFASHHWCVSVYKIPPTTFRNLQKRSIKVCTSNFPRRRVVVTGIGVVSPVGCDTKSAWKNVLDGYCGIKSLEDPTYGSLPCRIAATIDVQDLKLSEHFAKSELRSIATATAYALIAGSFWVMSQAHPN